MRGKSFKCHSPKWQSRLLDLAAQFAQFSKQDWKVGAAIATKDLSKFSFGYNGLPSSVDEESDLAKGLGSSLCLHAEANALMQATFGTRGCVIATTYAPCLECAKLIVQAKLDMVIYQETPPHERDDRWRTAEAIELLDWSGLDVIMAKAAKEK